MRIASREIPARSYRQTVRTAGHLLLDVANANHFLFHRIALILSKCRLINAAQYVYARCYLFAHGHFADRVFRTLFNEIT